MKTSAADIAGLLGVEASRRHRPDILLEIIAKRELSGPELRRALVKSSLPAHVFATAMGITSTSLLRLFKRDQLTESQVDKAIDLLLIWTEAAGIFRSFQKTQSWMDAYVPVLRGKPSELLRYSHGRRTVIQVLERIDIGEFWG